MLTEGMFLVDRYEILSKIGAGGMSDVYKAKDHILGRLVAIKVLKNEFSEDINFVTKFRTEAQSAAGLEHPNIVNIYDVGSESGMHFIVMEYVEGITLKTYIEKKGQLSFKEATSIAIQVARGIEAAHNKDITHRDIKPQNIMISTEGKVKVTDFGIAKAISSNTLSSDAMGSVHYVSPEQARNGFIDGRSDIYSLGIVMYEMVTGRVPFDGETTVAVAIQHLQEEMVEPSAYAPEIPISYEKIVLKTTQKSPERRYQSIGELLADLRKALATPDEDFVVIAPLVASTTRVINGEDLEVIQTASEDVDLKKGNGFVSMDDEDEEENEEDEYDDEEEEDLILNPKMEKIVSVAGIAILAIILLIVIFLLGNMLGLFDRSDRHDDTESADTQQTEIIIDTDEEDTTEEGIEMISIVGQSVEDAEDILEELGLRLNIKEYRDTNDADGTVLEQDVNRGETVAEGTVINVVVAGIDERDLISIPSVISLSEASAKTALENAGFTVSIQKKTHSTVAAGMVISQDPNSGKAAKGSVITIVVSEGKPKVTVPTDLVGKDVLTAGSQLSSIGLGFVTEEEYSDAYAKGVVTRVDGAGTQVASGTSVKLYVSKGVSNVQVPSDLKGKSLSEAKSKLESLGFKVATASENSETVAVDYVIRVSDEGKQLPKGSTVTLTISKGAAPVKVPTGLVGQSATEAQTKLEAAGFVVDMVQQYNTAQPEGKVFKVDNEGAELAKGSTVRIYVSLGAEPSIDTSTPPSTDTTTPPSSEASSQTSLEDTGAGAAEQP